MFVSSYNTYINPNSSDKVQKSREEESKKSSDSFSSKLLTKPAQNLSESSNLPINYVSNYKVLNNQQKLYEETQNKSKENFTKINALTNAKDAYSNNSKIFSLLIKPRATLDQTPQVDKRMPVNAQEGKAKSLRHAMINTYIANDNYYKITA